MDRTSIHDTLMLHNSNPGWVGRPFVSTIFGSNGDDETGRGTSYETGTSST